PTRRSSSGPPLCLRGGPELVAPRTEDRVLATAKASASQIFNSLDRSRSYRVAFSSATLEAATHDMAVRPDTRRTFLSIREGHSYYLARVKKAWQKPAAWLPQGSAVYEAAEAWERSGRTMSVEQAQDVFRESYR